MCASFRKRLMGVNLKVFSREHSIILEETENMTKDKYIEAYEAFIDPLKDGSILAIEFYKSSFKRIIEYFATDADKLYPLFLIHQPKLDEIIRKNIPKLLEVLNDENNEFLAKCISKWTLFYAQELLDSLDNTFLLSAASVIPESNFITLRCWFTLEEPFISTFLQKFLDAKVIKFLVERPDFFKNIDYILRFVRDVLFYSKTTDFFKEFIKQTSTGNLVFELFLLETKSLMKILMLDILTLMKDEDEFVCVVHDALENGTLLEINRKEIPNLYETPGEDDLTILEIINQKLISLKSKTLFNPFNLSFHMLLLVKMEMCFNHKIANFFIGDFNNLIYLFFHVDIYSVELGAFHILKFLIINDFMELKHYSVLLKEMYKVGRRHYIEKNSPCSIIISKYSLVCKLFELIRHFINENNEIVEFWEKEMIKDTLFLDDFYRQRMLKDDVIDKVYVNFVFEEFFSSLPKSKFFQSD
ncbi:hypothetical protein CDIK_3111 [Cucumispora dikerogammari]|nr:hypothetical protein CDIK_3111 [Cucumispora dikerogammari]